MSSTSTSAAPKYTDSATGGSADADEMGRLSSPRQPQGGSVLPLADPPAPICALPGCGEPVVILGHSRKYCCDDCAARAKRLLNNASRIARARARGVRPKGYNSVDVEAVRRLAATDMPITRIAEELGHDWSSIRRCAHRNNIKIKRDANFHRLPGTSEAWDRRDALAVDLHHSGLPYTEIARRLTSATGIRTTKNAVIGRLNRLGLIGERKPPKSKPPRVELPDLGGCMFSVDVGFCGEPVEGAKPYCGKHAAICYRPSAPLDLRIAA